MRRVHLLNLLHGGRAQNLDDLDELISRGLAGEEGLADQHLGDHAPDGPDVDGGGVLCGSEDEFWSAVVAGANVGDVGLACNQPLG